MDLGNLLVALARGRIDVDVVGGKLQVKPAQRLTEELIAAIREHRAALLNARCETCGQPTGGYGYCDRCGPFGENAE